MIYRRYGKRGLDVTGAMLALVVLGPALLLIALLIRLTSRGSVLYVHERIGRDGVPFDCLKFRTMIDGAAQYGRGIEVTRNDERITLLGRVLRRWSIDELPQLINVLRGEMSLVGPRPSLACQVERYNVQQRQRLLVRPGLTGWAQVNGRNTLGWTQRMELDAWYVEHHTLWLDLLILWRTPRAVWCADGIYGHDGIVRDVR